MALFDLPAIGRHIKDETGYKKVAYIGHSQGNASMFSALLRGMVPSLGNSLPFSLHCLGPCSVCWAYHLELSLGPTQEAGLANLAESLRSKYIQALPSVGSSLVQVLDFMPFVRYIQWVVP